MGRGTRDSGLGDSETWDVGRRTRELREARGLGHVINKQHLNL